MYFSPEEVSALEGLAKDGGFYRIRAPSSIKEDANTGAYVMSFVPACALIASRFTEHLVFHLGKEGACQPLATPRAAPPAFSLSAAAHPTTVHIKRVRRGCSGVMMARRVLIAAQARFSGSICRRRARTAR